MLLFETTPTTAPARGTGSRVIAMVSALAVALGLSVIATPAAHAVPVGGTVTGTVTSASTGLPIPGLQVQVNGTSTSYDDTTDASGEYEVTGIEPGDYTVYFAGADLDYVAQYWPASLTVASATRIEVTDGTVTAGIDAVLDDGATISGRVVEASDPSAGIPGLQVAADQDGFGPGHDDAYTDANGSYTLRGLPAGSYRVSFFGTVHGYADEVWEDAYDYDDATLITVVGGDTITGINAELDAAASISGRVVSATDPSEGLEGVWVQLTSDEGSNGVGRYTDESGDYSVEGLAPGQYRVQFQGAIVGHMNEYWEDTTSYFGATPIALVPGQNVTGIDATLLPSATITGRVTADGSGDPLAGVWVYANSVSGGSGSTTTDGNGEYSIGGLAPGDYRVNFNPNTETLNYLPEYWSDQDSFETATIITVPGLAVVSGIDASLAGGSTISGNVKGDDGSGPVDLAGVSVSARTDSGTTSQTTSGYATTDAAGNFTMQGLAPGEYQLDFYTEGTGTQFASQTREDLVVVGVQQNVTGIDTVLGLGGRIIGIVSGPGGPLSGVDVMLRDADEEWYYDEKVVTTGADGSFQTRVLEPGDYLLTAELPWDSELNYLPQTQVVTVTAPAGATQNFTLQPGGSIAGTVTGTGGAPVQDAEVRATSEDGEVSYATTDASGHYLVTKLPTGTYTVSFRDTGAGSTLATEWWQDAASPTSATELEVVAGQLESGIDAQLGEGATISGTILDELGEPVQVSFYPVVRDATSNEVIPVNFSFDYTDGSYVIRGLPVGSFKIGFSDKNFGDLREEYDGSGDLIGINYDPPYLDGKTSWATADVITVTSVGQALTGHDVVALELSPPKEFTVEPVPTISGALVQGRMLTATLGDWVPAVGHPQYRWLRDGEPISFATDSTYVLRAADVGHRISVQATGTLVGYESAVTTSVQTAPIVSTGASVPVPTVSGEAKVGETLTADPGSWAAGTTLTYQWTRDGVAISGATAGSYQPTAADLGALLAVVVSGSSDGTHVADSISLVTAPVVEGAIIPGTVSIQGTGQVGVELTADPGTWNPADVELSYVWQSNGAPIAGATGSTYTPTADQEGKTISLVVTGSKDGYIDATATSLGVEIAPAAITAGIPTVSGTPVVDGTLTVDPGTWDPEGVSFTYQWAVGGEDVVGATGTTFTPRAADVGSTVTVTVTGMLAQRTPVTVTSAATAAVAEGTFTTVAPTISGTAKVGETLTASVPAWTPEATSLSYQWKADGAPIGADSATLELTANEADATITVTVTGTRDGYAAASATSLGTAEVSPGDLTAGTPTISGTAVVDGTLTAHPGTWSPSGVGFAYQWVVDGMDVVGATDATFTPRAADVGSTVTVTVTGSLSGYAAASVASTPTAAVAAGTFTTVAPTISGTAKVGETLTASVPAWTPEATSLSYQWKADGAPIGADSATLTLTTAEAGAAITVTVTGTRDGYTAASATSAPTSEVATGDLTAGTPTISGTPVVDGTLTAHPGTWSPAGADFSYQWAVDGEDVVGATAATYSPKAADAGLTVTVTVTGTLSGYVPASATSAPTAAVAEGTFTTVAPTISGTAKVGETLTASVPAWTPEATSLSYQWKADGSPIGADSATVTLTADEAGATITVTVTGTRDGYTTASATSTGTSEVASGDVVAGTPTISGTPVVGGTLTAHPGTWSPAGVTFAYQWAVDGEDVAGATGTTFTPRAEDAGLTIMVTVTGTLTGYAPATATSAATSAVASAEFSATPAPTISGTSKVGETLTASVPAWTPEATSTSLQWYADDAAISGATASTLVLGAEQLGARISVKATGSRAGYETTTVASAKTAAVAAAEIAPPTRLSGDNRFDTAVAISSSYFEPGVARVYVANGYGYPDALSAAPAAAHFESPLLLIEQKSVPAAVLAEINRLQPAEIVIVGGTGVVTDAVRNTLAALSFGPEVRRIGGLDRYETSRALASDTWGAGEADTAYLATGVNFPDALSASPAAAHFDGPVVLVPGTAKSVDAATRSLLSTLGVQKVKLAGGTGVVSSAIENQLKGIFGAADVIRNGGADRYLTSVAINADAFDSASTVYLATGSNYADALAGAALAGTNDAPLFTTLPNCVPQEVLDAIDDLGATTVVLLGGTGVLTPAVANLTSCG